MPRTEAGTEEWFQGWHSLPLRLLLFPIGAGLCFAAFFLPDIPFALALLPLVIGVWSGAGPVRFTTMTSFMIWPVFLSAWGLHGLDVAPPGLVMILAAALTLALGLIAAQAGIMTTTLLVSLIPVFPASPLLALAALLPGLGITGLFCAGAGLLLVEAIRTARRRQACLLLLAACLGIWNMGHAVIRAHPAETADTGGWREETRPRALSGRARAIALRDSLSGTLPEGGIAVLGENVFAAEDDAARAFWCHAVTDRALTLYAGVAEPYGPVTRGAVWRLDAETCADAGRALASPAIHRATFGIPHLTGTWGPMGGARGAPEPQSPAPETGISNAPETGISNAPETGDRPAPPADWLICLEAFLPLAWAGLLLDTDSEADPSRPVMVLANDTAFRPLPALFPLPALGTPPVHVLRRKAASAMAGLAGRAVYFAETGRTILIHDPERTAS